MTDRSGEAGERGVVPVSELSYTEASRELDAIVEFFEQREVDVDLLVSRLERATAIVDELDRRIRQTRMQVEELVPRLEAATRSAAAPAEDRGEDDASTEDLADDSESWDEVDEDEDLDEDDPDSEQPLF